MMKIENYPEFLCTVDKNPTCESVPLSQLTWKITAVAIPWKDCEYVPAIVNETSCQTNHPFPVKFLKRPKDWFLSRTVLVVRTDVYPLWWIYVWLQLQVENLIYNGWWEFMRVCNWLKIAETPLGSTPSFRDFGFKGYKLLNFVSWVLAIATAITWFLSDYPYVGFAWVLAWGWVQYRIRYEAQAREKIIEEIEELESRRRAYTAISNLAPAFPPEVLGKSDCPSCKYFYGKDKIVCAVHPSGYEGEFCGDRGDG